MMDWVDFMDDMDESVKAGQLYWVNPFEVRTSGRLPGSLGQTEIKNWRVFEGGRALRAKSG